MTITATSTVKLATTLIVCGTAVLLGFLGVCTVMVITTGNLNGVSELGSAIAQIIEALKAVVWS